jgi:hypothetical protein
MTKLLNIAKPRQDFCHVIIYVLQFCSHAVLQTCSRAVVQSRPGGVLLVPRPLSLVPIQNIGNKFLFLSLE